MNVRFCIEYYATEGQSLHIVFSKKSYAMQLGGNGIWSIALELKSAATYHYELRNSNGETLRKEPTSHKIARLTHDITVYDRWWDTPIEQPFYSSFFTDVVLRRRVGNWKMLKPAERSILLEVDAPTLLQDERLAIVGGSAVLGGWNVEQAVQMNDATAPTWKILLPLP